jgi:serine/threonine protein phosphatase PrpC
MSDNTIRQQLYWTSAQASHAGVVRRSNEDAVLASPATNIWAVADGMGGYEAGNVASEMIIRALAAVPEGAASLDELISQVELALFEVNREILAYADNVLNGRTMGSTVVSLIIDDHAGACLWAGDSRLYRYRDNRLTQLSRDHSHVEELVAEGIISPEEARNHPNSNLITRAIGTSRNLRIDLDVFSAHDGDIFLLCSDGLSNMLSDMEMVKTLADYPIELAVEVLIQQALDRGAHDNVSVILVKGEAQEPA